MPVTSANTFVTATLWYAYPPLSPRHLMGVKWGRKTLRRDRVPELRRRLRAQGLRPVQIWVPDVRAPEFVAEAHRQSMAIAASEGESDDPVFVDAISVEAGDDPESAE